MPILIVAGEPSGDERASEVLKYLLSLNPELAPFGMGGDRLRAVGSEIVIDIRDTAVFGILEAVRAVRRMKGYMECLLAECDRRGAKTALLVDFGGFNLRLAARLKERGIRVVYYISPQVWASRPGRAKRVKQFVDLMLVLFPFEVEFYKRYGVEAVHVGHPLLGAVRASRDRAQVAAEFGFDPGKSMICLMPGSRESEIRALMPVLKPVVANLRRAGHMQFSLIAAPGKRQMIESYLGTETPVRIVEENKYDHIAAADLVLLASGTAALEVALLGVPAVILYRTSWITGALARLLLRVPFVSLPNIILDMEVYPELLQKRCTPLLVTNRALDILEDELRCGMIRAKLADLAERLGPPGAAARAAAAIHTFLGQG